MRNCADIRHSAANVQSGVGRRLPAAHLRSGGGVYHLELGEGASHEAAVACDERVGALHRMCADEEVRDYRETQLLLAPGRLEPRILPDFAGAGGGGYVPSLTKMHMATIPAV